MVDGLVIFIGLAITILDFRRGFFRAVVDMLGVIVAFKLVFFLYPKITPWFINTLHFSAKTGTIISCILIFFGISGIIFAIGAIIYSTTLLTLAPVFEEIFSGICAFITAATILRFILILVLSVSSNEEIKTAINNSLLGEQLVSLSWYHSIMDKLKPLTNPGELYF
jgi:uncharacterized membrane protein required for colicin V production